MSELLKNTSIKIELEMHLLAAKSKNWQYFFQRKDKYKEQKLQTAVCCFPNNTSRFSFYQGHCR